MMLLTYPQRRLLEQMPDLSFGEDKSSYVKKCVEWAQSEGHNTSEVSGLARMKWKSWEVERLITNIEEGNQSALQEAVILLLKDLYVK